MGALIVSDYDGTLKNDKSGENMIINTEALNMLLKDKNYFMISTGRLYKSIKIEIQQFNIPFNYISCANGNILFDDTFKVIFKTKVSSKIMNELRPFYKQILEIESFDEYGLSTTNNPTEYLIHLVEEQKVRRQIVEMLLSSPNFDYCTDGQNKYDIHIFKLSNKIKTIEIVRKNLNISNKDIYTIGDGSNDINMLKKYNGYIIGMDLRDNHELDCIPKFTSFSSCTKEIHKTLRRKNKK